MRRRERPAEKPLGRRLRCYAVGEKYGVFLGCAAGKGRQRSCWGGALRCYAVWEKYGVFLGCAAGKGRQRRSWGGA